MSFLKNVEYENDKIVIFNNKVLIQLEKNNNKFKLNDYEVDDEYMNKIIKTMSIIISKFNDKPIDITSSKYSTHFEFKNYNMIFTYYESKIVMEIYNKINLNASIVHEIKNDELLFELYPKYFHV